MTFQSPLRPINSGLLVQERFILDSSDILMNVEALKAYTTLSAKEKHAVEKSLSNFFRLGIGEDNPRIISSQLQRHAFKRGSSRFQYALSCECGSQF